MKEILLPELGEGISDVEIRDVLVKEGDFLDIGAITFDDSEESSIS